MPPVSYPQLMVRRRIEVVALINTTPSNVPIVRAFRADLIFHVSSPTSPRSRSVRQHRARDNALAVLTWSEICEGQAIRTRPGSSHVAWLRSKLGANSASFFTCLPLVCRPWFCASRRLYSSFANRRAEWHRLRKLRCTERLCKEMTLPEDRRFA